MHLHDHEIEDHDRGLAYDLAVIERQIATRRRALQFFGGASLATLIGACGGGSGSSSGSGTTGGTATATPTATATATATPTASPTATSTPTATCIADPTETAGPYPADGTNASSGSTSNVLTSSGIIRSDIRPSFIGSTTVAAGVLLTITLTVVNSASSCAPLAGYAVYLWHCDALGRYSLYSSGVTGESYLRGVQVTDANGQVTFTTIYPACYDGRWPHMHFEVFASSTAATSGRAALLTSQLAIPAATNLAVFNGDSRYSASVSNYARVTLASDGVFGDNSAAQIAQQTPTMSGSVTAGYIATAVIGLAR